MPKSENTFNFGTGSIDKDQWQRDIDNEQDAFISRYTNATNKKSGLLLRQAFQELRRRIASGDMLNRTADGLYQFGSALNRDDKGMQEAYQRALGFMGDLARRQIQAPPPEPEKKAIGNLEERYIKSLNPSGKFNTDAYWKNQTDEERRTSLKNFLNKELKDIDNYQDFGEFGNKDTYTQRLQTVMNLLESGKANDWSLQQLGFTKNWLTQPTLEEPEEKKSELEQVQADIAAAQEAQQVLQGRQFLAFNGNRGQQEFNFTTPQFDLNYKLQHLLTTPQEAGGGPGFAPSGPNSDVLQRAATYKYISDLQNLLDLYFKNFATSWRPNYESGEANQKVMQDFLSKLFSTYSKGTNADGSPVSDYAFDWKKYFTLIGDNQFLINGSINNQTGRYAYYVPGEGIREDNILDNPNQFVAQKLGYTIPSLKEGGKVKFLQPGGGFDYDAWIASLEKPKTQVVSNPQQTSATKKKDSSFSTSENARIAATIADIASMGAAFVPGYGTATSAILGLGSTATNFGADLADGQGLWNATKNAGFGLAADVMGLIPGLGGVGKGAKIARNLMWAVPKMMQWVNTANGLANAGEIKNSIVKLTSPSSMTVQDWLNVSQALQIMTGHGRSIATKVKKAGMSKTTTTTDPEYYIFTNNGKQKVSDETFKRLREVRGTKARQALTEKLMGEGVTLLQTRFAPWNTSTKFGAFKEVPGQTKVEIQNKHKGWLSDENLVERVENANPSVDIRSIMHKVNPYRSYYSRRNQPVIPQRNYSDFEARLNGEASPLNVRGPLQPYPIGETYTTPKTKRKPLTDQQKAARKQKAADKKSKEQAKKQLEELRRNQGYALAEEIPQAGTYADIRSRQQDAINLSNKYANEVELPIPTPRPAPGPRSDAFNKKYGKAIGKKEIGGILRALRNGGIIKAETGVKLKSGHEKTWYNDVFSNYEGNILSRLQNLQGADLENSIKWLNEMLDQHSNLYRDRGDFNTSTLYDQRVEAYQRAYSDGNGFILLPNGFNIGIAANYNDRYDFGEQKRISGDRPTEFVNDGFYSAITDDRRVLGRTGDWTPELLSSFNEKLGKLGYIMDNNYSDGYYRIKSLKENSSPTNPNDTILQDMASKPENEEETKKVKDLITGIKSLYNPNFKNPTDPSPWLIAGKTALGLAGNRNIYKNLLEEMPQAPLRDPLNRQLAIVGWLERLKEGQNQLADLRNATWMLHGSDLLANFATMLEAERVGRGIMDTAFREDSGRQFETAGKLWNLKNEDVLYNTKVGDDNRRAIADRARMMAQIRAAWRSGDNNILMGALADTSNWLMKKYQREQDLVDKARELSMGDLNDYAEEELSLDENYKTEWNKLKAKREAGSLTEQDKARINEMKAQKMKEIRGGFALRYYNTYHIPGFGGGFTETVANKDGGKLEIAKLKARGKDNDRYVSMMKDMRKTSYRRRKR